MLRGCVGGTKQSFFPGDDYSLRLLPYRDPLGRFGNPCLLQLYRINTEFSSGWLTSIKAHHPTQPPTELT